MAARDSVDLDRIVDYRAEYAAVIEKYKITGDNLIGLCPFHDDRNNSFSVDLKTGKWHCFAENESGNFISFWAKIKGVDTRTAYKEILEKYGVSREKPKPAKRDGSPVDRDVLPYTLEQYSEDKKLPLTFLEKTCGLSTGRDRDGTTYLKIPYWGPDGQEVLCRKRYAKKEFRWGYGAKGKIIPYGVWRLQEFEKPGYCVLVEGESDTQSLWRMGIPAIGVAGATLFKTEQAEYFKGLKLYIHQEPDTGGQTFTDRLFRCLHDGGFTGEVYRWDCKTLGEKDPSDIYIKYGRNDGARLIRRALDGAERINLEEYLLPEAVVGAPITLRQPEGYIYSDKGIRIIDQKTLRPVSVCRTPIILTKRLKSLETGDEKMEIAFKRDDKWHTAIFPRSTIFSSRKITDLSDLGCTITSENAKQVVKFLGALEAENIDLIPMNDSTSTLGWQPGRRFLPGHDKGITLDIDPSQRGMAAAYCQNGTFERWIERMRPHRARNKFRFILAASFAAPLLRILKQRIFIVYNWGGSKGGKTAALKAALSAWGDPERLMTSFNATRVGLERMASFYCDLPLGIDERQLAGTRQGALEEIVYMISSGTGKVRGSKTGGLQTMYQWRTVALATGEEPLATETSQTGVSTRVLEIYGGPFDNETDASLMHQQSVLDCGWAGPAFIERILAIDEREIVEDYERMLAYVRDISKGKNGAHIAGISTVALADAMIDKWFFGGSEDASWALAQQMAADILLNQVENNTMDINENATQFIVDWVLSNKAYFGANAVGTCLGFTSESGNTVYIFPSMLNQALTKAGYTSPRKIMKYLAEQGLVGSEVDQRTQKKVYSVRRWFLNRTTRFVEFHIGKISEQKDPVDDVDEAEDAGQYPPMNQAPEYQQESFYEVPTDEGSDLPF
jgi:putative DNA primase/helicase